MRSHSQFLARVSSQELVAIILMTNNFSQTEIMVGKTNKGKFERDKFNILSW